MIELANKYGKSIPQVALRYLVQKGVSVVPKTVKKNRMIENISIFDFKLSEEEMSKLKSLDTGKSSFFSHDDPDQAERLINMVRKF
jgi:diketogulonate reductase-like aldo/keto reductase